jgi:hypothetical protein
MTIMNKRIILTGSALLILLPAFFMMQGCSKNSNSNSNSIDTTGYYFAATINGQFWSSNLTTKVQNAPAAGVLFSYNNTQLMLAIGIKANNNDSSAFFLIFPTAINLNQSTPFDSAYYVDAGYVVEASPGSSVYNAYSSSASYGGSGTLNVSLIDQTSTIIKGTFSGILGSTTGGTAITISNGMFRCPYTTNSTEILPAGSGITVKF